jgi:DNA invertase Pin-like site-specific DNA recombinase
LAPACLHPEKRLVGYARVSTYGQTLDAQLEQLRASGCSSQNIYRERVTGARADRRELLPMLDRLAPGDVVTVTRIGRLARSTFDLFGILKRIVDAKAQIPIIGGTVGRHLHQHRALDACGIGGSCRCLA